jgi:hypothetical protein
MESAPWSPGRCADKVRGLKQFQSDFGRFSSALINTFNASAPDLPIPSVGRRIPLSLPSGTRFR